MQMGKKQMYLYNICFLHIYSSLSIEFSVNDASEVFS